MWCYQWRLLHLGLTAFLLSLQYVTHPAEQSVLIHVLWANVNFNSSGESGCARALCTPLLLSRYCLCTSGLRLLPPCLFQTHQQLLSSL